MPATPPGSRSRRTTPAAPAGASQLPSMRELDHVALLKELGRECLSSSRRALEEKQGADFDRCYVVMAIGAHMKANDAMTVFQRHASDGLAIEIGKAQRMWPTTSSTPWSWPSGSKATRARRSRRRWRSRRA